MTNRITVRIGGLDYTILAEDDPQYVKKTAELVDRKLKEVSQGGNLSALTAAVMAALNIADDYYKAQESTDNLRAQIREYADEAAKLRMELARAKK
ncbi:cell division protein ZapA [Acidaminobacterium chupaoyuni]